MGVQPPPHWLRRCQLKYTPWCSHGSYISWFILILCAPRSEIEVDNFKAFTQSSWTGIQKIVFLFLFYIRFVTAFGRNKCLKEIKQSRSRHYAPISDLPSNTDTMTCCSKSSIHAKLQVCMCSCIFSTVRQASRS